MANRKSLSLGSLCCAPVHENKPFQSFCLVCYLEDAYNSKKQQFYCLIVRIEDHFEGPILVWLILQEIFLSPPLVQYM